MERIFFLLLSRLIPSSTTSDLSVRPRLGSTAFYKVGPWFGYYSLCLIFSLGAPAGFENALLKGTWSRSDGGGRVAVGGADRTVTIWNVESGQIQYKLPGHKGTVTCVDFHPKEPISASFLVSWFCRYTDPVRSTDRKQRHDAPVRRTRGDCAY